MKVYDRAYYDRWYRNPNTRVSTPDVLERKVHMTVSVTEFLIGHPVRTVIDVGCGEGQWQPALKKLRPDARYIGIDSSEYAIARYGKTRNIRRGSLGDLGTMRLPRYVDLIVCADVLQYVDDAELQEGLHAIRRMLGGLAYLEAYTTADSMEGDVDNWHKRTGAQWRRMFQKADLTQVAPYLFIGDLDGINEFERFKR